MACLVTSASKKCLSAAKCCLRVAIDTFFFRSPSKYSPTSRGVTLVSSIPCNSAHARNRLTATKYAERVCSFRIRHLCGRDCAALMWTCESPAGI